MSRDYGTKLRQIRLYENLTQKSMSDLTGISVSAIKGYETQGIKVGISIIDRVLAVEQFEKYMKWLMTDKTDPAAGQISPLLSPGGSTQSADAQASTEHAEKSPLSDQKIG